MTGPVYIVQSFGDLERDQRLPMSAHASLEDALDRIQNVCGAPETFPDPEDDRIVVWCAEPGERVEVAWHFSGWHWDHDAADLPGGPIDQGSLLTDRMSLYMRS